MNTENPVYNTVKLAQSFLDYRGFKTNQKWKFYDKEFLGSSFYPGPVLPVDLNDDGRYEYIFSINIYPFTQIPIAILGFDNNIINLTQKYLPDGTPTVGHSAFIYYADINGDAKSDIIVSEAGFDYPPWDGSRIGLALRDGLVFRNLSEKIPSTKSRAYAIGVADFNNDGRNEILVPGQGSSDTSDSYLLIVSGIDITTSPNPLSEYIKQGLNSHTAIVNADFNNDRRGDLLLSGAWTDRNNRILYGSGTGFDTTAINILPTGPLGEEAYLESRRYRPKPIYSGPEVNSIVFDIDNDGLNDVFSIGQISTYYSPGSYTGGSPSNGLNDDLSTNVYGPSSFWITKNINGLNFFPKYSSDHNLGDVYYKNIFPFDINSDGNIDVIGHYWTVNNPKNFGTTIFVNNGSGQFKLFDGSKLFPGLLVNRFPEALKMQKDLGWIVPISNRSNRLEGLQIVKKEVSDEGLFSIQAFSVNGLDSLKNEISSEKKMIFDRKYSRFLEGGNQGDVFFDVNPSYRSDIQFEITLELVSKNIRDTPNFSMVMNGKVLVDKKQITVDQDNKAQFVINANKAEPITSLQLAFDSLKYINESTVSYIIIRSFSANGSKVQFIDANFSNGFAFNEAVAQANGDGAISFGASALSSINKSINSEHDVIDGGQSIDTCCYSGLRAEYTITKSTAETLKIFKLGEINDLLANIERLQFKDISVAFDTSGIAGTAYRIYKAAFNRTPDTAGLGYWIAQMDKGVNTVDVAARFIDSPEFRTLYGQNPSNADFLTKVYTNVLGRTPDQGGYNWWLNELNTNPSKTKAKVLADFSESGENQTGVASLIGTGITYEPWMGSTQA
jgi:hypothetical protein